ncbi:MAG: prepilin-type N-terminal cleavage/methylation domain-containing protein [Candidatus Omnitrophota bacterium]
MRRKGELKKGDVSTFPESSARKVETSPFSAGTSPFSRGFTLIELVIAVAISTLITAALYFSLKTALESWDISQDQLLLQQASSRIMEELVEGLPGAYGLRDALEVVDGTSEKVVTVMPWTDDTHDVYTGVNTYTLNKHIKPGASLPIAEALLPESNEYKVVPVTFIDKGKSEDYPQFKLDMAVPAGSHLRFTFYPDYGKDADCLVTFRYDPLAQAVFIDDKDGSKEVYKNPFGVKITDFKFRYFDNTNSELGSEGSIATSDIPVITAIEIAFTAQSKNGSTRQSITFVALRNAPMRSGNLMLKEGARFPIPDSREVKALYLDNLSGIDNKDSLILEAKPESGGSSWVLKVQFSKISGLAQPLIETYTIEYPEGNKVFSARPRLAADLGLNLLSLGYNGLYDYGFNDVSGEIILDGKVYLEVKKMDIGGASLFVRP